MTQSRLPGSAVLITVAICLPAACSGGSSPLESSLSRAIADVNPQLSRLSGIDDAVLIRPGVTQVKSAADDPDPTTPLPGILGVMAWLADAHETLPAHARLQVTVRTSDGDMETLALQSPACLEACRSFDVGLRDAPHAYALMPRLDELPARFTRVVLSNGARARVWLFAEDMDDAMRTARDWPGVRYVRTPDDAGFATLGLPDDPQFSGALPVEIGPPISEDGKVQVREGTSFTIEYTQPNGAILKSEG